jgi:RNA polymerase sigma factor (sigma-70 family)
VSTKAAAGSFISKKAVRLRQVAHKSADYDELYQAHHEHVRRLCRLLLADLDEADDVSQEVFIKLLQQHRTAGDAVAWERWLTTVTVNACRDRRRSGWWKWWRERHHELDDGMLLDGRLTPEDEVSGAETVRRIWAAFRGLSARQQEVFTLRQLEGWSTDEVAASLGLSAGSVKRHLYRAVHQLRAALRGQR